MDYIIMQFKFRLLLTIGIIFYSLAAFSSSASSSQGKHFEKIMIIIFENMSYVDIKHAPIFKKLIADTGYDVDEEGARTTLNQTQIHDSNIGHALFTSYYNNHSGGIIPTRPSQPNYLAMTSGSTHGVIDNNIHDLKVDNLANELIDAGISWKVYAEDLPDPFVLSTRTNSQIKLYKDSCFMGATFPSNDGYKRKHEPFISYVSIQENYCKNIVNSAHLNDDLDTKMPFVSFYIPNQLNDGHNGGLLEGIAHANAFLSKMMGANPQTGELLPDAARAPLQKFMSQGGLVVIAFDEPSATALDQSMYMLLMGRMVNSGAYSNHANEHSPICYPAAHEQIKYLNDSNGTYQARRCNHYNLLKMIEANYGLRSLHPKNTSSGYKYAYALDQYVPVLWKYSNHTKKQ